MSIAGLLLRALAVAILFSALALPLADHHAGARLPELGLVAPAVDVRLLIEHHHGQADDGPRVNATPAIVPGHVAAIVSPPTVALGARPTIAVDAPSMVWRLSTPRGRIPAPPDRSPPTPPPEFALAL